VLNGSVAVTLGKAVGWNSPGIACVSGMKISGGGVKGADDSVAGRGVDVAGRAVGLAIVTDKSHASADKTKMEIRWKIFFMFDSFSDVAILINIK
jgi:hypothetical protein